MLTVDIQDGKNPIVGPYPFDMNPFVVTFPGRLIPNRPYATEEEFLNHFYGAERIDVTCYLHAP